MSYVEQFDGLSRDSPQSRGISPQSIIDFLEDGKASGVEFHSFMLYSKGAVVAEAWWDPYRADLRHMMHSATKSFLSVAVGMAIQEGHFSLQSKVMSIFPEYLQAVKETNSSSEMAELLTVEDLLTQTSGHATGSSGAVWRNVSTSWIEQFFKIPIVHKPGTFFKYSSAPSYLLSAIIHRTTGQSTKSFLMPRLFQPLGMTGVTWDVGPEDINPGGNGISCRSSDLLKLAILHLQGGVWQGQRLLSEEWVASATRSQRGNDYGYQWWMGNDNSYYAYGVFGQFAYVSPQFETVLVITSAVPPGEEQLRALIGRHFPRMLSSQNQIPSSVNGSLKRYLSGVHIEFPTQSELPEKIDEALERLFVARANVDGVEAFTLGAEKNKYIFNLWDARGLHRVDIGLESWLESETTISLPSLHHSYDASEMLVATRGNWLSPNVFEITLQFIHTAFQDRITICLGESQTVILQRSVNVNSLATQRPPIVAYALERGSGTSAGLRITDRVNAARQLPQFDSIIMARVFPYSTQCTSIDDLLDNEETKAAVMAQLGNVVSASQLGKGGPYTLRTFAVYVPEISLGVLDKLDVVLAKIVYPWY
ncbi:hypothetical protein LTR84_001405 [Exophiala bonariae]|uniref:Beta-lactamase-related domain-containing protein n=1 Tax=Exophiala bonariae TaxID=1690606 RepID=A0AAV9NFY4_9EURO|nr:hypothetical protein LTR84_001405 [Exophiala bonariae]